MIENGLIERQNITIDYRSAEGGSFSRLHEILRDLHRVAANRGYAIGLVTKLISKLRAVILDSSEAADPDVRAYGEF